MKKLYIFIFCLILSLPLIQLNTSLFNANILNEKRNKLPKPTFSIKEPLSKYTKAYENYYNDNFGFRDVLIRMTNTIDVELFNKSTHEKVLIGTNGYLYHGDELKDYNRTSLLKDSEIELIANKLKVFQDNLKQDGTDFFFYVAPNKSTIYPEYVGFDPTNPNLKSNYERLMVALEQRNINTIDAKSLLLKNKEKYSLFYKRDTHWNKIAASLVANEFLSQFKTKYNFNGSLSIGKQTTEYSKGDLDGLLGIDSKTQEATANITVNKSSNLLPKTVAYFDSFSFNLLPLINSYFSLRWDNHYLDNPLIETFPNKRTDTKIVYFQIVERNLQNLLSYNFDIYNDNTKVLDNKTLTQSLDLAYDKAKTNINLRDIYYQAGTNDTNRFITTGNDGLIVWQVPPTDFKYVHLNINRINARESVQLFWLTEGGKWSEQNSRTLTIVPGKEHYIIGFDKELKGITKLRLDIGNRPKIELNINNIDFYK